MNLTPQEMKVWMLIAQGLNRVGIAKTLQITESTVNTHTITIYEKLGISGLGKYRNLNTTAALMYLRTNNGN